MTTFVGEVETVTTLDCGRGVRCSTNIRKGTTLLREGCIACVLCEDVRGSYCDHCLLPGYDKLMRCSGCKFARYCNRKCQKNAWVEHKEECKGLQRVAPNVPTDTVRLLARIMWRSKRLTKPAIDKDDKNFPLTIEQLQGDVDKMVEQRRAHIGAVFFVLEKFLGGNLLGYTAAEILRLFVVVEINGFHLFDHELKNIGYALYQRASMVNHHCEPNCLVVFDGPILEVRSLQDLKEGMRNTVCPKSLNFTLLHYIVNQSFDDQILKCVACPVEDCYGLLKKNDPAEDAKCASCGSTRSSSDALWENALAAENSAEGLLESANNFRKNGDILFIKLQSIMSGILQVVCPVCPPNISRRLRN
ncbi:putative histone-lysine N-methyltransferase SMYD3 [Apostichopus japonicus]|uniref:Putative histone-lysine N-methyltransferase SMYD3 n=1 Tax=Stichopus japonicus TaxID=307972 RepID=A0A2G8KNR8_STIJA|nr:putative histone-lysine N-methyltransferase SMYD3 [Apostichopus japonicus]